MDDSVPIAQLVGVVPVRQKAENPRTTCPKRGNIAEPQPCYGFLVWRWFSGCILRNDSRTIFASTSALYEQRRWLKSPSAIESRVISHVVGRPVRLGLDGVVRFATTRKQLWRNQSRGELSSLALGNADPGPPLTFPGRFASRDCSHGLYSYSASPHLGEEDNRANRRGRRTFKAIKSLFSTICLYIVNC